MSKPFESFATNLNYLQVSLLLDTVSYFEDAPKLLSIPGSEGTVMVPLLPVTLSKMLGELNEQEPSKTSSFAFAFEWTDEALKRGIVIVTLPSGEKLEQPTDLAQFSAI